MYEQDMTTAFACTCIFMANKIPIVLTSIHIINMSIRILPKTSLSCKIQEFQTKNVLKKNHIVILIYTLFGINGSMTIVLSSHQPLIFDYCLLSTRYVFSVYLAVLKSLTQLDKLNNNF